MKIYTVIEADYEVILGVYSFKTRGDAEEFVLSCAEEYALNLFNGDIECAPVPSAVYVLSNWGDKAILRHKSRECYGLSEGAILFLDKIYESEVLD